MEIKESSVKLKSALPALVVAFPDYCLAMRQKHWNAL